jgi:co-chaperonin GroES (HSP10)
MILRTDWIHVSLVDDIKKSGLVLPEGTPEVINDEVALFQVHAIGKDVEDVRVGDHVVLLAAMGSLARFKYKDVMHFVTKEGDVIAIMNRSEQAVKPKNER